MPATTGTAVFSTPSETEILIVREFAAPPWLVFRAWTTPELVSRWWTGGCNEMKVAEIDLRVGGAWRWVLVTPDGHEVAFHGEYREVVEDERLVYTEIYEAYPGPGVLVTVDFEETEAGDTLLSMRSECGTREVRDVIMQSGMESGAQAGFDLLEQIAIELAG
jgi:uncharacterized protein YndB with AHSA1/START domain